MSFPLRKAVKTLLTKEVHVKLRFESAIYMPASAYNTNEPTTKIAFCIWVLPTRTLDRGPNQSMVCM